MYTRNPQESRGYDECEELQRCTLGDRASNGEPLCECPMVSFCKEYRVLHLLTLLLACKTLFKVLRNTAHQGPI